MKAQLKYIVTGIFLTAFIFTGGVFFYALQSRESYRQPASKLAAAIAAESSVSNPSAHTIDNVNMQTPIVRSEAILAIPLGDDRVLMGASHNVFVGKVMSQGGYKRGGYWRRQNIPDNAVFRGADFEYQGKFTGGRDR
jgi:hypothetical protein